MMELGQLINGNPVLYEHEVSREWQDAFCEMLYAVGLCGYGFSEETGEGHECEAFVVRPYYWGECIAECEDGDGDAHAPDCPMALPNFAHRSGYRMTWYKYPLRGAYANRVVTREEFMAMLRDCVEAWAKETIR